MAERSFPFNSIAGDRKYKAERWREYFALFIGNGIFYKNANALKVKENEGMMVTLQDGAAWVAGGGYINEGQKHFTLEMADGVLPRIVLFGKLSAPRFFTLNAPVFRMVWINIQNS